MREAVHVFRIIGDLAIAWVLAGVTLAYIKRKLKPWQHRRHMSRITKENAELDDQLDHIVNVKPREKT